MNSRQSKAADAWSVTACTLTSIWQLPTLPKVPEYCRATPGEDVPYLGNPVSSITHATGATTSWIRAASRRRTTVKSQADELMNCCNR
jgi:hypothetical protein